MKYLESFDLFGGGDWKQIHRGLFNDKWRKRPAGIVSDKEALKLDRLFMEYFGPGLRTEVYGNQEMNRDMTNLATPFYYYGEVKGKDKTFPKPDEPKPDIQSFFIFVYDDDWYVVEIDEDIEGDLTSRYFECDGFEGIEKLFEDLSQINEARLIDLIPNLPKEFKDSVPTPSDNNKLVSQHTLKTRVQNQKVRVKINWNDKASHDLKLRIKDRTNFQNLEEFNKYFKEFLDKIFPNMIGKEISVDGNYGFYFKEKNMTFIIQINVKDMLYNNIYNIYVRTVKSGYSAINVVKVIVIEE